MIGRVEIGSANPAIINESMYDIKTRNLKELIGAMLCWIIADRAFVAQPR
jgi:hypothetical protein